MLLKGVISVIILFHILTAFGKKTVLVSRSFAIYFVKVLLLSNSIHGVYEVVVVFL